MAKFIIFFVDDNEEHYRVGGQRILTHERKLEREHSGGDSVEYVEEVK